MPSDISKRRNRVGSALKDELKLWKEGVSLENSLKAPIDALRFVAASHRLDLADQFRKDARRFLKGKPPAYRSSISRSYYAAYHAIRACAYIEFQGDDHQEHSKLQAKIPSDFPVHPTGLDWQQELKKARLLRNRADYEIYPRGARSWKQEAEDLYGVAVLVLASSRAFLASKGCTI